MIKYYFLLILFSILACKQNAKHKTEEVQLLVPETEIFQTIDSIYRIDPDNNYERIPGLVGSKTKYLDRTYNNSGRLDSFFTKDDLLYMKRQEQSVSQFNLKPEYFPDKIIIPEDTLSKFMNKDWHIYYKKIKEKYGSSYFNVISMPLFSIDRKTVLIHKYGMGQGGLYIYKKENNNWIKVKTLSEWIE